MNTVPPTQLWSSFRIGSHLHSVVFRLPQSCFPRGFCSSGGICWENLFITFIFCEATHESSQPKESFPSSAESSVPACECFSLFRDTEEPQVKHGSSCEPGLASRCVRALWNTEITPCLTLNLVFQCLKPTRPCGIPPPAAGSRVQQLSLPWARWCFPLWVNAQFLDPPGALCSRLGGVWHWEPGVSCCEGSFC